jgi:hypothetical protein
MILEIASDWVTCTHEPIKELGERKLKINPPNVKNETKNTIDFCFDSG